MFSGKSSLSILPTDDVVEVSPTSAHANAVIQPSVSSFILFIACVLIQIVWSIWGVSRDDIEHVYSTTALGTSLSKSSYDLEITNIACYASVAVGFTMVVDLVVEYYFSSNDFDFHDPHERWVVCVFAFVPCMLPVCGGHGLGHLGPYMFLLFHCLQLAAYNFVTLKILNKAYPSAFDDTRSFRCLFFGCFTLVCTLIGFNRSVTNWLNCLTFVALFIFIYILFSCMRQVFIEQNYSQRESESYSTKEIYALYYFVINMVYLAVLLVIWGSFSFEWTNFNVWGTNGFIHASILFSVAIFCIPSKAAAYRHRQSELEQYNEKALLEQTVIRNAEKLVFKHNIIRYISHEVRTPVTVARSSIVFALENMLCRDTCDFEETRDFLRDGLHSCEVSYYYC